MAELSYPVGLVDANAAVLGNAPSAFTSAVGIEIGHRVRQDYRYVGDTTGTIANNNRVFFKADATSPEVPFAGARVRLHKLQDGSCVWSGWSDASGYYRATGLEVGREYYPVAIDPTRTHQVTAAGPVVAVKDA